MWCVRVVQILAVLLLGMCACVRAATPSTTNRLSSRAGAALEPVVLNLLPGSFQQPEAVAMLNMSLLLVHSGDGASLAGSYLKFNKLNLTLLVESITNICGMQQPQDAPLPWATLLVGEASTFQGLRCVALSTWRTVRSEVDYQLRKCWWICGLMPFRMRCMIDDALRETPSGKYANDNAPSKFRGLYNSAVRHLKCASKNLRAVFRIAAVGNVSARALLRAWKSASKSKDLHGTSLPCIATDRLQRLEEVLVHAGLPRDALNPTNSRSRSYAADAIAEFEKAAKLLSEASKYGAERCSHILDLSPICSAYNTCREGLELIDSATGSDHSDLLQLSNFPSMSPFWLASQPLQLRFYQWSCLSQWVASVYNFFVPVPNFFLSFFCTLASTPGTTPDAAPAFGPLTERAWLQRTWLDDEFASPANNIAVLPASGPRAMTKQDWIDASLPPLLHDFVEMEFTLAYGSHSQCSYFLNVNVTDTWNMMPVPERIAKEASHASSIFSAVCSVGLPAAGSMPSGAYVLCCARCWRRNDRASFADAHATSATGTGSASAERCGTAACNVKLRVSESCQWSYTVFCPDTSSDNVTRRGLYLLRGRVGTAIPCATNPVALGCSLNEAHELHTSTLHSHTNATVDTTTIRSSGTAGTTANPQTLTVRLLGGGRRRRHTASSPAGRTVSGTAGTSISGESYKRNCHY